MEELDRYIKECNLVFTDTIDRLDFCIKGFDVSKVEPDFSNSISLLDIVSFFNREYQLFRNEYEKIEKIDFGEGVRIADFSKFKCDGDLYRNLTLYIDKPKFTKHYDIDLYLREINGKIKPFATNRNDYYEEIEFNSESSLAYLDLFEKYSELLKKYKLLKNNQLFGDGTNCIFTTIDNYKSNLLDGLNNIRLSVGSSYFDTEYYIEWLINLGDNFDINYDNCKLVLDCKDTIIDKETYNKTLASIYLNKKYTNK